MAKQMVELDILHVHVRLKGITRAARRQFLRLIRAEGVYVTSIEDVTPIPFNGTRLRSKRRR
jgi:ribosomal protein S11